MNRMLGLTLTQPFASLVALGAKRVVTRDWGTDYRGALAIHAAKGLSGLDGMMTPPGTHAHDDDLQRIVNTSPYWDELRADGSLVEEGLIQADRLPRFAIVAVCTVAAVAPAEQMIERMQAWVRAAPDDVAAALRQHQVDRELALGDYGPGMFAWRLADVRPVEPLVMPPGAVRYYRNLWRVPDDIAARVEGAA